MKMKSERIPRSLLRGQRAKLKLEKIPYISKIPCSLQQGSSIPRNPPLSLNPSFLLPSLLRL
jgi:hypothetical protein